MISAKTPSPSTKDEDIVHTIRDNRIMYDVGSPYPGTEEGPKGLAVRQLKRYARNHVAR